VPVRATSLSSGSDAELDERGNDLPHKLPPTQAIAPPQPDNSIFTYHFLDSDNNPVLTKDQAMVDFIGIQQKTNKNQVFFFQSADLSRGREQALFGDPVPHPTGQPSDVVTSREEGQAFTWETFADGRIFVGRRSPRSSEQTSSRRPREATAAEIISLVQSLARGQFIFCQQ